MFRVMAERKPTPGITSNCAILARKALENASDITCGGGVKKGTSLLSLHSQQLMLRVFTVTIFFAG